MAAVAADKLALPNGVRKWLERELPKIAKFKERKSEPFFVQFEDKHSDLAFLRENEEKLNVESILQENPLSTRIQLIEARVRLVFAR